MIAAIIAMIKTATRKKIPPTSALFDQKPLLFVLLSAAAATVVVVSGGGAVGVTVKVSTCPVTVITDMNGVGVQVLLDDELVLVDVVGDVVEVDIVVVVGVAGTVGVVDVEGLGVVGDGALTLVVEVGIISGVGVMLVLVDVVEGV